VVERLSELELKLSSLSKRLDELEKRLEMLERRFLIPPPAQQEAEKNERNEMRMGYLSKTIAIAKREYQKTL